MATIADVLHHLVNFAAGLSEVNRAEAHKAIDDFLAEHFPGLGPRQPTPEEVAAAEAAATQAKIASLKAELAGLEGETAPTTPAG